MEEVAFQGEGRFGRALVLTFDGRVVELFGFDQPVRYHVSLVQVAVGETDRHGNVGVSFRTPYSSTQFEVGPDRADAVLEIVARVQSAIAVE